MTRRQRRYLRSCLRKYFRRIVVLDFEYEIEDGGLPNVLCLVAYILDENLRHIETIRRWRGEFGTSPPFPIDDDTLVVGYSLWAEMTCFLAARLAFSKIRLRSAHRLSVGQQHPAAVQSRRETHQAAQTPVGCLPRLRHRGLGNHRQTGDGQGNRRGPLARIRSAGSAAILRGGRSQFGRAVAPSDSPATAIIAPIDPELVMRWSEYSAKTVARIQAKGMPIDMALWNLVQENKAAVIGALIARFDPSQGSEYPIYSPEGEFSSWRFEQWLISAGITEWPRLDSGALQLDGDAFRMMYGAHPAIEGLHALRDSLGVIVRARIPIGPDGRNRPSLFPFGTATGRNAQAKSLFNAHASMRSFMKFPADKIGLYLDWRTQEVGIAAARSGDAQLAEDYLAGDIYHALAMMCGLTSETDVKTLEGNSRKASRSASG